MILGVTRVNNNGQNGRRFTKKYQISIFFSWQLKFSFMRKYLSSRIMMNILNTKVMPNCFGLRQNQK